MRPGTVSKMDVMRSVLWLTCPIGPSDHAAKFAGHVEAEVVAVDVTEHQCCPKRGQLGSNGYRYINKRGRGHAVLFLSGSEYFRCES